MSDNKKQILLPICTPPITSYQQIALPLTVAMNNTTAINWFFSNYVQVLCINRKHYFEKENNDNALHYNFYSPNITSVEPINQISIDSSEQLFFFIRSQFVKDIIDDGWYIYTHADMFYIDGSNGFGFAHYPHDLLIYGYDDENIYIYMYNKYKLASHKVKIDNFLKGYFSEYCDRNKYKNRAMLIKTNNEKCRVNLEKIRWYMQDYLNGTETFARENPNIFNPDSLTVNGVDTYREFDELLDYAIINEYKDLRRSDLYCFYEHKKVMFDRVIYLRDNGFLSISDKLLDEFEMVKKQAEILMFLGLKMNTLENPERKNFTLLRMKDNIKIIKEHEVSAWNRYIDENKEVLG